MEKEKKQPVTVTLDPRSVDMLNRYSAELHLTRSAFVDLMVTQIDQVLRVGCSAVADELEEKEGGAGCSGDD